MESFDLWFDGDIDPDTLVRALGDHGIPSDRVLVGDYDPESGRGVPHVWVKPGQPGEAFGTEVDGHFESAEPLTMSGLDWARFLTPRLGRRCLVDDETSHPDRWYLVTPEGGYGKVIVDADAAYEGQFVIDHATVPIPGAPELRVEEEPDWVG